MMTRVSLPVGRGSVFSAYSHLLTELRFTAASHSACLRNRSGLIGSISPTALRLERVAARSVARHPHHHLHEFVGIVSGLEDALQRVTADAAAYPVLLLFGSRHAHEPFGIGELRGYIGYLAKLEIHRRRRLRRNRDCDRACQIITHSAHGDGVLARVEPVLWE